MRRCAALSEPPADTEAARIVSFWPPRQPVAPLACVTMAHDEPFFLEIWARHYLAAVPGVRLFVLDHGSPQDIAAHLTARIGPQVAAALTVLPLPATPFDVEFKAAALSSLANTLLHGHQTVITTDADEIVLPAPGSALGLCAQLAALPGDCLAPTGFAFIHDTASEPPLDLALPVTEQRRFGLLTAAFTKPAIWRAHNQFGPGQHRSALPARLTPELVLAHLNTVDQGELMRRRAHRRAVGYSPNHTERGFGKLWRAAEAEAEVVPIPPNPLCYSEAAAPFLAALAATTRRRGRRLIGHDLSATSEILRFA